MKQSETNKKRGTAEKKAKSSSPGAFVRILQGRGTVIGEKLRSDITAAAVIKYVIYSVLVLLLVLLKTTFFSRFRPFGASPDILITATAAIALYEGGHAGAIFGLLTGYFADALGGVGVIIAPLPYMLTGYFCGIVATDHYKRSWVLYLIFDLCACVVRAFTSLLYVMITWRSFDLPLVISSVIVPELLSTVVISPLPALLLLPVYLGFRKKKRDFD